MIYRTTVLRGAWTATLGNWLFLDHPDREPYSLRQAAELIGREFRLEGAWLRVYQLLQAAGHLPRSTESKIEPATPALVSRFIIGLLTDAAGLIKAEGSPILADGKSVTLESGKPAPPLSDIIANGLRFGVPPFDEVELCPSQSWARVSSPGGAPQTFMLV
ncbi:hypothetical protein [Roseomonas sp. USHLN139]|uniref:hypothetical protein n=1 Tax=Roseomonas sp. USHLN139 TaxID=3081298 RepID=UPI003B012C3B